METAIISGKGGTGKSCISAAFATLSKDVVLADCDVDAANLYILFNPANEEERVYIAGQEAVIDYSLCNNCRLCMDYCRFEAISSSNGKTIISPILCEGCKLCSRICPVQAITMVDNDKSRMYSGIFRNGRMVYGRLAPGEENSGKLVNMVREKAKQVSKKYNLDTIIIDGPPGIGCPVISTITGVNRVVIVTEPTIPGWHDLKNAIEIAAKFNLKTYVIINKYDLNNDVADQIETYCINSNIKVIGKIPFDNIFVEAMVNCKTVIEWDPDSLISKEINSIWKLINSFEK